jgi:peroxiredoxin Q/BCP
LVNIGDTAPLFILKDQDGQDFSLQEHIGKHKLVIYFYPKDESTICTKDVCAFRDKFAQYTAAGAMVIGISKDSVQSHKAFIQNHGLPFTLLSDPDNKVPKLYDVKNNLFGGTGRETFIIDTNGKIVYKFRLLWKSKAHPERALGFLKR